MMNPLLERDRSGEQHRRTELGQGFHEWPRALRGKVLGDLQRNHQVEVAVQRERTGQIPGEKFIRADLEQVGIDVVPVNAQHLPDAVIAED
jgi:hypothetical protein